MEVKTKIPLYLKIYNNLKEKIISNVYQNDEFLSSERELGEHYGVERATVRRALDLLVKDGLLVKVPGAGSKIKAPVVGYDTKIHTETNNIAFILPGDSPDKITQPFISSIFYRFEEECKKRSYHLFYTNLKPDDSLPDNVLQNDVKGIVWVSKVSRNLILQAKALKIPSVLISNSLPECLSILCDNINGSYQVVEYLIGLGHRKIAYINGIPTYMNAIERYEGYLRCLAQAKLPNNPELMLDGQWTFDSGYECTMRLLEKTRDFTALYAANDMMALGALKALSSCGLSVPGDVSLIGFDNIEQCKYITPTLTTIGVDSTLFAKQIFHSLSELMQPEAELPPVKIILPTQLHVRESTAPPKSKKN